MDFLKIIEENKKKILYGLIIIVLLFWGIRSLNSHYEKEEKIKDIQFKYDNSNNSNIEKTDEETNSESYSTESKSIPKAIESFISYCNNKEIENAYKMLTDECKNAMFSSPEEFEELYVNNLFDIKRTYELDTWITDDNKITYLVTLYGDILATGKVEDQVEDYFTLIKMDNGTYRLNVNNYIYGENKNVEYSYKNIIVKIGNVDIYEDYEEVTFSIINNSDKKVCIIGNKIKENIYLQNIQNKKYLMLGGILDIEDVVLEPNTGRTYTAEFSKSYSSTNKINYLIFNDVILDYEDYLNSINNSKGYNNRTSLKVNY